MDQNILDLQRRLRADPGDEEALNQLARATLEFGDPVKAYSLLVDHGALKKRSPFLVEIGGHFARAEKRILRRKLGKPTLFAVDKGVKGWRWLDSNRVQAQGLPVLAIKVEGKPTTPLLKNLSSFPLLQALDLAWTNITDEGLAHLASHSSLKNLDLSNCKKITDGGLAHLASLSSLQSLDLARTRITNEGLSHLASLTSLHNLNLSVTEITDEGLAQLVTLTFLRTLKLVICGRITGKGLAELALLTSLQTLDLSYCCGITDEGLAHVASLASLHTLKLEGLNIADESLAHLASLTSLQTLHISFCYEISDGSLVHLASLTSLQYLDLTGTGVEFERARELLPFVKKLMC